MNSQTLLEKHITDDFDTGGQFYNRLILFGRRFGLNHEESEDVVSETYLDLLTKSSKIISLDEDGFDKNARLRAFFCTAVRYKALYKLRNKKNHVELREDYMYLSDNPPREGLDSVIHNEECRRVQKEMDALLECHRGVLQLRYFKGFSYNRISDKLNIPLGTVKSRMYYGIQKMAEVMK
jgi:RNA polymerase sigma-70 factor, ECF subfamily